MDVLIVRTKLQALISLELINKGYISRNFIFVSWLDNIGFETAQQESFYKEIRKKSIFSLEIVESTGFIKNWFKLYCLSILTVGTFSKFIFAIIDADILILVKKLNPFLRIETFDDGIANIIPSSEYFYETPLKRNGTIRRDLLNFVFPRGCNFYVRNKSSRHFTIYKDFENIVDTSKVVYLEINFLNFLKNNDAQLLKDISNSNLEILVGTTFDEYLEQYSSDFVTYLKSNYKDKFDLIILHPRDNSNILTFKNSHKFESPAEAVVQFFVDNPMVKKINLYHFRSSCIVPLLKYEKVDVIDLWTNSKLKLWDDDSRLIFVK